MSTLTRAYRRDSSHDFIVALLSGLPLPIRISSLCALANAAMPVSKLSRLKEKEIRLIATQYITGSGPGSPAGQPDWGGGSDRILNSADVKDRP
jgi:hypothetical protein